MRRLQLGRRHTPAAAPIGLALRRELCYVQVRLSSCIPCCSQHQHAFFSEWLRSGCASSDAECCALLQEHGPESVFVHNDLCATSCPAL